MFVKCGLQTKTKSELYLYKTRFPELHRKYRQHRKWLGSAFLSCMFLLTCLLVFKDLCTWVWVQKSSISNQYQRLLLFWYFSAYNSKIELGSAYLYVGYCVVNWCFVRLQRCTDGDDGASPSSSCSVAVATHRERRLPCSRMERKMEENTVRDVETGV